VKVNTKGNDRRNYTAQENCREYTLVLLLKQCRRERNASGKGKTVRLNEEPGQQDLLTYLLTYSMVQSPS